MMLVFPVAGGPVSRIIQVPVNDVSFPGGWRASEQDNTSTC